MPAPPRRRWRTVFLRRASVFARRFLAALVTLVVISLVVFGATSTRSAKVTARAALGFEASSPELIDAYIKANKLDRPMYVRYGDWVRKVVEGDFGISYTSHRSVWSDLKPRFINTLRLTALTLLIGLPLSIAVGVYMAVHAGSRRDLGLVISTVIMAALPEFVIAIMLISIFAVYAHILPVNSTGLSFGTSWEKVQAHVLPVTTLILSMLPYVARITRVATRETLASPYVQAAVLRGLPRVGVLWRHGVRNALVTVVNAVAINVVWLLGGVIIVENVFGYPGMGQLLVDAIGANDITTIQAVAMLMGAMFITISLAADVAVMWLNPKLRN